MARRCKGLTPEADELLGAAQLRPTRKGAKAPPSSLEALGPHMVLLRRDDQLRLEQAASRRASGICSIPEPAQPDRIGTVDVSTIFRVRNSEFL